MAHPQHNFTSNFNGSEGHNAELTLNINGTEHKYTPAGNDKEFTVTGAVRINVNLDGSELVERITTVLNGDSLPLLVQQNLDGTEDSYTYVGLQDNEWLFGRVTTTHIDSVGIDTTDGSVRRETLPLASDVAIVSNTDPAVYTKLRTAVALGHLPVLDYQGTYATYVTIDNNILKFATEAADPNVESYVYTVASDNTVTATPRNAGVVRADSVDTEPGTLIDKLEVVDNVRDPDDPALLTLGVTVDAQGKRKVAINEDNLRNFVGDVTDAVLNVIDTLDNMDFDAVPHGSFGSSLNQSPGDGTTTSIQVSIFRPIETTVGDAIKWTKTTEIGGEDFGTVTLEPGTYIICSDITCQWVGVPAGTYLAQVGNVLGEPFDFSQQQELHRRMTNVVTVSTTTQFKLRISFDAATPVMGFWINSAQIVKIAGGMSQTNVTHDSTLVGQGSVADPLGVTPAAFGKVKDIPTSISQFRTGDVIPVDGPSGTAKMSKDTLLTLTAQNALAGNVAPAFSENSTSAIAGKNYVYGGKLYQAKENYSGSWDLTKFILVDEDYLQNIIKMLKLDKKTGKNICNAYDTKNVKDNYYVNYNAGRLSSLSDWSVIQFPVIGGRSVSFSDIKNCHISFFSKYNFVLDEMSDNTVLPGYISGIYDSSNSYLDNVTIPATAVMCIISAPISRKSTLQCEYAASHTSYEPYKEGVFWEDVINHPDVAALKDDVDQLKSYETCGKNLCNAYNPKMVVDGYYISYNNNGRKRSLAGWSSIQFPVEGGRKISSNVNGAQITFYSAETNLLTAADNSSLENYISGVTGYLSGYDVPATAKWCVISIPSSAKATVQVEYGLESTSYEPYVYGIGADHVIGLVIPKTIRYDIYADGTGDFTDLRACLESITDSSEFKKYEVYIHEGTYDIASLFTAEEIAQQSNNGLFVPNFTTLIGVGNRDDIVLSCVLTSYNQYFSPLHFRNDGGMKNITLTATKCRYTVHDDISVYHKGGERLVENCKIIGNDLYYGCVYGSGMRDGLTWKFKDTVFDGTNAKQGGGSGLVFLCHNNLNWTKPSSLNFENCRFLRESEEGDDPAWKYAIRLRSLTDDGDSHTWNNMPVYVHIYGCLCNGIACVEEPNYGSGCAFWIDGFGNKNAWEYIASTTTPPITTDERFDLI